MDHIHSTPIKSVGSFISTNIPQSSNMYVIKRDGRKEPVHFDKISERIRKLSDGLSDDVNVDEIARLTIAQMTNGISTRELDILSASIAANHCTYHEDYALLAGRIEISNLRKNTHFATFKETTIQLRDAGLLLPAYAVLALEYAEYIESIIDYSSDYTYDFFAVKTLQKGYMLKHPQTDEPIECPQHTLARVALYLCSRFAKAGLYCYKTHQERFESSPLQLGVRGTAEVRAVYNALRLKQFTFATPTIFNAGCVKPQLFSCFLVGGLEDDLNDIYKTLHDCAVISKSCGGIGMPVSKLRGRGMKLSGGGKAAGLVPFLRVFDATLVAVDQGGRRPGSNAPYIEVWHTDIQSFLELRKNHGDENSRARNLFYALWIDNVFMERVLSDGMWSIIDPVMEPRLATTHGEEFRQIYEQCEADGKFVRQMKARDLWNQILDIQTETGMPYIMWKDHVNAMSNHSYLGTIRGSNLCTEIVEYHDKNDYAVCCLASVSLPAFVSKNGDYVDTKAMGDVVALITRCLNRAIELNWYPVRETFWSNIKTRPIGIGVQGLADLLHMLDVPFQSETALHIDQKCMQTIYYRGWRQSMELARDGIHHKLHNFDRTDFAKGIMHHSKAMGYMGKSHVDMECELATLSSMIENYGVVNSMITALMPTASTSQILGNNECFEPFTTNLYKRRTGAGDYLITNKHLLRKLRKIGLWDEDMRHYLLACNGSIQDHPRIPNQVKEQFKTVWEIKQKWIIDHYLVRQPWVDQAQSMNLFIAAPTRELLTKAYVYSWKNKAKNGVYYLRRKPATEAIQFTVDKEAVERSKRSTPPRECIPTDDGVCMMCSA